MGKGAPDSYTKEQSWETPTPREPELTKEQDPTVEPPTPPEEPEQPKELYQEKRSRQSKLTEFAERLPLEQAGRRLREEKPLDDQNTINNRNNIKDTNSEVQVCKIMKNGMCVTHDVMTSKIKVTSKLWKDRGGGKGYGWTQKKVTKAVCRAKNDTLVGSEIYTSRESDNSHVTEDLCLKGKVTIGGQTSLGD